jgi:Ferric iron reductase FhuF-like transporter
VSFVRADDEEREIRVFRRVTQPLSACTSSYAISMRRYTRILLAALIPPLIINGLAFEAHPQNTLVRISTSPDTRPCVLGFVMRDLGGIRVHPPTLLSSTSTPQEAFRFLPNHCIVTKTREEAAAKLYHTLVQNHLQRLARVLGLHYLGEAWDVVRGHLAREMVRQGENGRWLYDVWMREGAVSVEGKCLLRMKLVGVYRDVSVSLFPSLWGYADAPLGGWTVRPSTHLFPT